MHLPPWHFGRPHPDLEGLAMTRSPLIHTLALAGLLAANLAFAADADKKPGADLAAACAQDVKTLCPGIEPGDGRIAACLKEHRRKVSSGCKDAIKDQRAAKKAAEK